MKPRLKGLASLGHKTRLRGFQSLARRHIRSALAPPLLWERGSGGEVRGQRQQPTTSADLADRLRVYLRALEAAAVVNVDRLPLGEELERAQPGLAVAVAGAARAAER